MQLTQFSDYALRILLYLGANPAAEGEKPAALLDISRAYGVSFSHLSKVAQQLAQLGFINAQRGRSGGLRLACPPAQINIGAVVRATETNLNIVECFHPSSNTCPITPACGTKRVLWEAREAFLNTLDGYTLADVLNRKPDLIKLWRISDRPTSRQTTRQTSRQPR